MNPLSAVRRTLARFPLASTTTTRVTLFDATPPNSRPSRAITLPLEPSERATLAAKHVPPEADLVTSSKHIAGPPGGAAVLTRYNSAVRPCRSLYESILRLSTGRYLPPKTRKRRGNASVVLRGRRNACGPPDVAVAIADAPLAIIKRLRPAAKHRSNAGPTVQTLP